MNKYSIPTVVLLLALAFATPLATAEVTLNDKVPLNVYVWVPCACGGAGETVNLTGYLHVLMTFTDDGKGGLHVTYHFQPQGVSGVGLTSGDKYQGTGVTRGETNVKPAGYPYETTFVNNFRIIGQGKGNNLLVHMNTHLTINANGEVTATHTFSRVECK